MENTDMLKKYNTIGRVKSVVYKAETVDEALKKGLKEILNGLGMEYAVIWYRDEAGDGNLHPYFCIAPVDLTSKRHIPGEETVGEVFATRKAARVLDYQNHRDPGTDRDFEGITVVSTVCAPLSDDESNPGCIQFINTDKRGPITDDEADICEILCLMVSLAIDEKMRDTDFAWQNREAVLRVRDIRKEFHNGDSVSSVLNGVNLDIYEGEFLAILGESGCGKSTFLNILGGLDSATSGSCRFYGEDITAFTQDQLTQYRRKNIGFIFQSYNLMPNLTAKQNLDLIGELAQNPMASMEALKLVGLENKAGNYPFQLSGGQQQRVSIARALVKRPKLVFADEPTAALDYTTSIEVLEVLSRVMKTGTTLVMVTHNEEISRMADRIVRMRNGKVYEITVNKHPVAAKDLVW